MDYARVKNEAFLDELQKIAGMGAAAGIGAGLGGAVGALGGAMQAKPGKRMKGALYGGLGGAAGGAALGALSRVGKPSAAATGTGAIGDVVSAIL